LDKLSGFSFNRLSSLKENLELVCLYDQTVTKEIMKEVLGESPKVIQEVFLHFDTLKENKVDIYEFITFLTMMSSIPYQEKVKFIYQMFDFEKSHNLNMENLIYLFRAGL